MRLDRRPRSRRIARLNSGVDRTVLIQKMIPRQPVLKHDLTVVKHPLPQQIIHRPHHMQHHHIVAGLNNGHVEIRVQFCLIGWVTLLMRQFHLGKDCADHLQIRVRTQFCRALGGQPLHIAAERHIVEHCLFMAGKQIYQTRRKS